jgi:hypothetical protein
MPMSYLLFYLAIVKKFLLRVFTINEINNKIINGDDGIRSHIFKNFSRDFLTVKILIKCLYGI